jgi:quercetin dioxygenase-like cupin family protein
MSSDSPSVIHWKASDGQLTESAMRRKLEDLGYRVSRFTYAPGMSFPEHTHAADKIDVVLEGMFRMTVDGTDVLMTPGDAIAVPRGTPHSAEVVGNTPVVSLDASRG